ncbi:MAG: hypothetical protein JWM49_2645 [Microbacteriaceae bacterium]|nr:hypothetical protein [Microbacteriaceae bacterium]
MRVYLDSSALVKRAFEEAESDAVEDAVRGYIAAGVELYSSSLAVVEVGRALRARSDHDVPDRLAPLVDVALGGVAEIPINDQIVSLARRIGPPVLRTLDAIHLASAVYADADLVMAFDRRVLAAAGELGFRVVSPGRAIPGA